jgi:glutamyl endopeptidase
VRSTAVGLVALATLAIGPVVGAQTEAARNPDLAVSSDGTVGVSTAEAGGATFSPSSPGRGPAEASAADAPNGWSSGSTGTARPMFRGVLESVIGTDGRTQVTTTTTYPARATAFITFAGGRSCTGWFISATTVATAGHCVHPGGSAATWYSTTSYRIYPGRNGTSSPYGYCTAKSLHSVTAWTTSASNNYDYGAIKLNCSIGNTVGWYGFFWQSTSLTGLPATIQGYPGDKTYGTQWKMSGTVASSSTERLSYTIDTYGGQSGSAVWYNRSSTCTVCSMGIHTLGGSTSNSATRITQGKYNNLVAWKAP